MQNLTTYLTAAEKKQFQTLPESLRTFCTVADETLTSYESAQALEIRRSMAKFADYPGAQKLMEQVHADKPEKISLKDVDKSILPEFFFTVGARGMDMFVGIILRSVKTEDDMLALATLTEIRHDLLTLNQKFSRA